MKYKLINNKTKEQHLCDKVTIDGLDYYVSDKEITLSDTLKTCYYVFDNILHKRDYSHHKDGKLVIATNNPNIDIPKVVNVFLIVEQWVKSKEKLVYQYWDKPSFIEGYNKSKENHPFSEEDMIEFYRWLNKYGWQDYDDIKKGMFVNRFGVQKQDKELIQIWKENKSEIVYYE